MENCQNRICVNPCTNGNPCDRTAECRIENHRAVCKCPPNYVGDPFVRCFLEPPAPKPECTYDHDCPASKACLNQACRDPCAERNPCSQNAECRTIQHHPTCHCPQGWAGDPQNQCYKRKYLFHLKNEKNNNEPSKSILFYFCSGVQSKFRLSIW